MTRLAAPDFGIGGDGATVSTAGFTDAARSAADRRRPRGLIGYGATLQQMTTGMSLFSESEPFLTETWAEPFTSVPVQHNAGIRIASVAASATVVTALADAGG